MFRLTSSLEDQIEFDEWAFAHADEHIRGLEGRWWELDVDKVARLGDEPKLPDSIAPDQYEPSDPNAPGFPEALRDLVDNLESAYEEGDEDGQINTLRDIADVEKSGVFAIVNESLWGALSEELRELAKQYDIEVGARLSALIDVALGCPDCWRKADRVRKSLIAALLAWSEEAQCTH